MMHKIIILLVGLFFINYCYSQEAEDTTYRRLIKFPILSFDYFNYSNSDFNINSTGGIISVDEYTTQLRLAIPIKKRKTYLFNGIKYSYVNYKVSTNNDLYLSKKLHSFRYNLGLIQVLPKRWKLSLNLIPTLSTDFKKTLGPDDFALYVSFLAAKRVSPNCEYGFGLAYTSYVAVYEGPLVVPLFSLTYKKNGFTTRLIFPSFISQSYEINEKTQIGFSVDITGSFYNINPNDKLTNYDLNSFSNMKLFVGPNIQRKLLGNIYLNGAIGVVALNKYDLQDSEKKNALSFNTNSKLYCKLGITLLK